MANTPGSQRGASLPRQGRTAYYLTLNNGLGAATGVLFWLLLVRVARLDAAVLGLGYTIVALGTVVGLVAKGGFDTALLLKVPASSSADGRGLFLLAFAVATGICLLLTLLLATGAHRLDLLPGFDAVAWSLVAAVAILLVLTWLQDAYFLAAGRANLTFERNLALMAGRLILPLPIVLVAVAHPVPVTWGLALAASALLGIVRSRSLPRRTGLPVPRREFLSSAARNTSGGAAEFLPGLLLAPLVFVLEGPAAAAYFGMAWTAASLVFQTSAAIGRSALAQMVHTGPTGVAQAIRRAAAHNLWLAAPLAAAMALLAVPLLSLFGAAYAEQGARVLVILCVSILAVAPVSLYLAVLRARDRSAPLVAFPLALILTLAILAPWLTATFGPLGVAYAWAAANAPLGLFAVWRLRRATQGVTPFADTLPVAGRADLE